jgi:alpha-mannosidase
LSDSESSEIEKQATLTAAENSISNDLNSIKIDSTTGAMLELVAVDVNDNNNLLKGNSSNLTYGFLDRSQSIFRAWDLTKNYWEHPLDLPNDKDISIKVTDVGPIYTTLEITRSLGISPVTQKISLFKECPEVFLEYLADWKQEEAMLKIKYSTATNAEICTADLAYCAIEAKTNPDVPCDIARFEKICHKYFDLSSPDKKWGLAMLNEGKYAFDVKGGEMKLTLLRACEYPAPAPEAWVNQERAMNKEKYSHEVPIFSGMGPFKCRYALFPHTGGALTNSDGTPNVAVKQKAEEFNAPIIVIPAECIEESENESRSLLEIFTPNVYLGVLKKNEWNGTGSIIARFVEGSGVESVAKIKFCSELMERISLIKPVDLLEREIEFTHEWDKDNGILTFQMGKFEICTFELVM